MKNNLEKPFFKITNFEASSSDNKILKGVNLSINKGEIHIIMGPNGSGKSTLCNSIMGHPHFSIDKGSIILDGKDITNLKPNEKANLGIFLAFQYPKEISGVTFGNFMRIAVNSVNKSKDENYESLGPSKFFPILQEEMVNLKMSKKFIGRCLNEGFSGGEKKRAEIVQMLLLKPRIAFLDEIDSGLDVDGLKAVAEGILRANKEFGTSIVLITHYARILKYLKADKVHILSSGKIVKSGTQELSTKIEKDGYTKL